MTTPLDIALKAQKIFHQNTETLIAGFLIRNPGVRPEDVTLVFQQVGGNLRFSVEVKELYVPDPITHGSDTDAAYVEGWNACRQDMIDTLQAKWAQADVHPLKEFTDGL